MPALYFYANGYNIKYDVKIKRSEILYQEDNKTRREEKMYTCAKCNILACGSQDPAVREKMPKNCPMREKEKMDGLMRKYVLEENQ